MTKATGRFGAPGNTKDPLDRWSKGGFVNSENRIHGELQNTKGAAFADIDSRQIATPNLPAPVITPY
jgi:hypothetical protein